MLVRSFLPVGQGAFFWEKFSERPDGQQINIVYDCGTSSGSFNNTSPKILEKLIQEHFKPGEVIHAIFISHLHDDHVNGIPFLLKYCNVKNIFFPLISEEDKQYIEVYNLMKNDTLSFAADLIRNPIGTLQAAEKINMPKVYQICAADSDNVIFHDYFEQDEYSASYRIISSGENVMQYIIDDECNLETKHYGWQYIPFNFRQATRINQLIDALKVALSCNYIDNSKIKDIWQNGTDVQRDAIKQAYRKVKGSMNTNSMTLYSGVERYIYGQYIRCSYLPCNNCKKCVIKPIGCLYMGDYDTSGHNKWNDILAKYKQHWNNIGCIQIPHHGSKYNYNEELSEIDAYLIISAGKSNKYNHPHSKVVKSILHGHHYPYIVTEDEESIIQLSVNMI